jgi:hypothetical protein
MKYTIVWRASGDITHRIIEAESPEAAFEQFKSTKPPGGVPTKGVITTVDAVSIVTNPDGRCLVAMVAS